ncbi:MAG: DUF6198 family protein [Ruminococcus sp.]|nr:DUF6198 family protein [Ruminococcus sp.]
MSKFEVLKRYILLLIGLFINGFGVSFITKASLGTSPISSIPYTLSLKFQPTIGMFTMFFSILLIILQLCLLKKNFPKQYWLQIPVSIVFSYFIDLSMEILSFLQPDSYIQKLIFLLMGCVILGFGVFIEVIADVVMLPGEAFVKSVTITFNTDFGKTKVAFDTSMTIIAGILSLIMFHRLNGVREGTIISAMLVGFIAKMFKSKIGFLEDIFFINNKRVNVTK